MEDLVGYVHALSPTKRSKRKSLPYFDFKLQTKKEDYQRVVCFNEKLRSPLESYQTALVPVKIRNASRSKSLIDDNQDNFLLSKRARIEEANNNEVKFEAIPLPQLEVQEVRLEDIPVIEPETKVHVRALFTKKTDEVSLVRNVGGHNLEMNDCCFLTDDTGTVKLTIWGEAIQVLQSNQAYLFTDLRVKQFQERNYLTATPTSTFADIEEEYLPPASEVIDLHQATLHVVNIELLDSFTVMFVCKNCDSQVSDVNSLTSIKCETCKSIMLVEKCSKRATIRIGVFNEKQELLWLTLLNPELQTLIDHYNSQHNQEISISSKEDVLCEALLMEGNFDVTYDIDTRLVRSLKF